MGLAGGSITPHIKEATNPMTTDDVRADTRRLLLKHTDKSDLSLDAPTSLDDIRERLARCTHGCRCDDGDHENAVHDLASSDVPVLLAAFEDALAELDRVANARRMDVSVFQDLMRSVVAAAGKTYNRDNHGLYQDTVETIADTRAERDAALAALRQIRDEAVEVMNSGGVSARELAEKVIYLIADGGGCR